MLGYLIDKIGKRAHLTLLSAIIGLLFFTYLYSFYLLFSMFLLGLCYSIFAGVIWPLIALVVTDSQQGLALGLMQSGVNFFCVVCPIIVSKLFEVNQSYDLVSLYSMIIYRLLIFSKFYV